MKQMGLPVSQEALFLLDYLQLAHVTPPTGAIDLGCGSGLLALGLALIYPNAQIKGFEIQPEVINTAKENALLNHLDKQVEFIHGDIRRQRPPDQSCDLVVANPPFRKVDTGKVSHNTLIKNANHEFSACLEDFIRIGSISLIHKGFLAVVMIPERLEELLSVMKKFKVPACRLRMIHHNRDSKANSVLAIGRKGGRGGLLVDPPLFVR